MQGPVGDHAALILIDVQPDFMPGGALACHEGDHILAGIDRLLKRKLFRHTFATQDWHPPQHISFASMHPGCAPFEHISLYGHTQTLWPVHCVQNTPGAALHPTIDWSGMTAVIRKGSDPQVDSYSGFRENHGPHGQRPSTGLADQLRRHAINEVYVCGLARDVCVLWTAQDAVELGLRTHVLWDLTRPVAPGNDDTTRLQYMQSGINVLDG